MNTQIDNQRELTELQKIRQSINLHYINTAWSVFLDNVELTDDELNEFKAVTKGATIVFTMPSEETLKNDKEGRFVKGRKFGREQWYKKTQIVGSALAILTSYTSYLRYVDSKENAAQRDAKKVDAAAAVLGLSTEELLKLVEAAKQK